MNISMAMNMTGSLLQHASSVDDDLIKVLALLEGIERLYESEQSVDVVNCLLEKCKTLVFKSINNYQFASSSLVKQRLS